MPSTNERGYMAGRVALELDGLSAGLLLSSDGGYAMADVVEEKLAADSVVHKHLGSVRYADIELQVGEVDQSLYEWIRATLERKFTRKDGAVISLDYDFKEQSRVEFKHTLVGEVRFPALDAASRDAARLTVKLAPEQTERKQGSGGRVSASTPAKGQHQKRWLPSNFRLQIDGLDCSKVSKIEPLVVKTAVVESAVGELRDYEKEPAHLEYSDLVVTLPESHAASFFAWHEDFVIKGHSDQNYEKNGKLEYLSADLKDVLFTLSFENLGIYKLAPEKTEASAESIRRVTAAMYCESIKLGAPAASSPATLAGGETAVGDILEGEYPNRFTRLRRTA